MDKRKILIQIDPDPQPSVFDRVVAIDAGVDEVFSHGAVKPEQVRGMVHGAIFTRHPRDLKLTAFFPIVPAPANNASDSCRREEMRNSSKFTPVRP